MSEAIFRQLAMLRVIPRFPARRNVQQIVEALMAEGFAVGIRTVQRDLNALSGAFAITNDTEGRTQWWYYPDHARALDIPGMSPGEALVFYLAEMHLSAVLPASQLEQLRHYFDRARSILENGDLPMARWRRRIGVIHRSPRLSIPSIPSNVINAVHEAMLHECRLLLKYRRRGESAVRSYLLDLQGLVLRDGLLYAVAIADGSQTLRHFALHRAASAERLHDRANLLRDFNLDRYLHEDQAFAYPSSEEKTIPLVLRVNQRVFVHLSERRLTPDQIEHAIPPTARMRPLSNYTHADDADDLFDPGQWEVKANVLMTEELVWWLLGFGDQIEIMRPAALRKRIGDIYARSARLYGR
jgi:predicted DNA-binding transcriptional regulator YafY